MDFLKCTRLRNGKTPPAGEELNIAIADLTGNNSDELIFSAYLEKSPEKLKQYIADAHTLERSLDFEIALSYNEDNSFLFGSNRIVEYLRGKGFENAGLEVIKELSIFEKWEVTNLLSSKTFLENNPTSHASLKTDYLTIGDTINNYKDEIPLFNSIFGSGFYLKDNYEGTIKAEINKDKDTYIAVYVPDGCLKDIGVKKRDIAIIELTNEFNEDSIFLISYDDGPAYLRKLQVYGDSLLIRPLNKEMKIEVLDKNRINIIGKLIEVKSSITSFLYYLEYFSWKYSFLFHIDFSKVPSIFTVS